MAKTLSIVGDLSAFLNTDCSVRFVRVARHPDASWPEDGTE